MFSKNNLISIRIYAVTPVHHHRTCSPYFAISTQIEKYFKINLIYIIRRFLKGWPDIQNLPPLYSCATAMSWVFYHSDHRKSNCVCWVFIINHENNHYLFCCWISWYFFLRQKHRVCSNCSEVSGRVTSWHRRDRTQMNFLNFVLPKITVV